MDATELKQQIDSRSRALGFDRFGVAEAGPLEGERERLQRWLAGGHHGDMDYLARLAAERLDPDALLPGSRSVLCFAHGYVTDSTDRMEPPVRIARYARGRDYHRVLRRKLRKIAHFIEESDPTVRCRACVDTAPILEKAWAERSGVGWRGKHTNVVVRSRGSWTFLGIVLTTAALPPDPPHLDFCGSCRRCLDACPTDAFPEPYVMDARRCISYLTIEHRGEFTPQAGTAVGEHLFGCDICLEVCPWNRFHSSTPESDFIPRPAVMARTAEEWAALDEATYDRLLAGSAMRRAGLPGLRRNATQILDNRRSS
jgi:epoxyqueuosine reductase